MEHRKWTPKQKLAIVLDGLKANTSIAELCSRHQISQTQYYKWRDRLMAEGDKIFSHGGPDKAQERLHNENRKLKTIIGELTVELKKNEYFDEHLQ